MNLANSAFKAVSSKLVELKVAQDGKIFLSYFNSETKLTIPFQSKQYLTLHTIDNAHPTDIYALAPKKTQLLSASGSSFIRIYSTTESDFPLVQSIDGAHPLGIHHLVTAKDAPKAASVGFEGTVKIWTADEHGVWELAGEIVGGYALWVSYIERHGCLGKRQY